MKRTLFALTVAAFVAAAVSAGPEGPALRVEAQSGITFDRILKARGEPHNWLTYSGDLGGQRYSPLTQITPANVRNLELQWIFQANSLEKFEATPLAVDGVLYTVQPPNDVVALDGRTGRVYWTYSHVPSNQTRPCCGRVNRGVAILGDSLFMATLDGFLVALDAKTGRQLWKVKVEGARPEAGYAFTVAPLVVKDKVIVGPAGGDFGIRGWLAAYDAGTGREVWRFYTIPGAGEPGNDTWSGQSWRTGGAAIWTTGSYDPETNLTFWGTGNPGPDWNGDNRMGDNLYADSVVALDADTGRLEWHFQFTPHDEFDYDSTQVPVLADVEWQGRPRKALLFANRNGFWYVLDRTTGEFLSGKPFTKVTWTTGLDAKGRPMNQVSPTPSGTRVSPAPRGWHQLVFAVVQPAHRAALRAGVDGHLRELHQGPRRVRRRPAVHRHVPERNDADDHRQPGQPPAAGRRAWGSDRARPADDGAALDVQDGRRDRRRRAVDRVGPGVLGRA
jgi:alcohol dehydrogenase (cytochrome c)